MSALTMIAAPLTPPRTRERTIDKPTPEPIHLAAIRAAADHFERVKALEVEAGRLSLATPGDAGRAWMVAGNLRSEAESSLVGAILATDPAIPDRDFLRADRAYHPARGVRLGDRVYLAVPDPEVDPDSEPTGHAVMKLVTVDLAAIANLDAK